MLESRDIVKKPLVTEKSTYLQDALNQYVFLVHPDANRLQVKRAVEEIFKVKVWGPINVGLLFALSEFVVAWAIAFHYSRRANREFDEMARELIRDAEKVGR